MALDTAQKASAIRRSLSRVYSKSDEELVARDARLVALFHAVGRNGTFSRSGAAAFEALATLILGAPLGPS